MPNSIRWPFWHINNDHKLLVLHKQKWSDQTCSVTISKPTLQISKIGHEKGERLSMCMCVKYTYRYTTAVSVARNSSMGSTSLALDEPLLMWAQFVISHHISSTKLPQPCQCEHSYTCSESIRASNYLICTVCIFVGLSVITMNHIPADDSRSLRMTRNNHEEPPASPAQTPMSELLIRLLAPPLCPLSLPKTWDFLGPPIN